MSAAAVASATLREVEHLAAPVAIHDIDLGSATPETLDVSGAATVLALVRTEGRPVALLRLAAPADGRLPVSELTALAGEVSGLPSPPRAPARSLSVVITTCRQPEQTARCVHSILEGETAPHQIVVVENRPGGGEVASMLAERFADAPVTLVEEPRPGLSRARNAGLAATTGEVIAFTDDDVIADSGWAARGLEALARAEDVECVAGLIMPLVLDTPERVLFEQFAGFGKGVVPREVRLDPANPAGAYTTGTVGSGANLFVTRELITTVGGFDELLGTGTPAKGGEDLDLLLRVLDSGAAIAYEPAAIVWHEHPPGGERLARQARDYGAGLTAMLTKQLVAGPHRGRLLRAIPAGLRYSADPAAPKNARKPADFPRALDRRERLGMALGPFGYLRSAARARWSGS